MQTGGSADRQTDVTNLVVDFRNFANVPNSNFTNWVFISLLTYGDTLQLGGTAMTQWLRCCATNRKVVGSIPDGVIEVFH